MGKGAATKDRPRLTAYLPRRVDEEAHRLADAYFSGVLSDLVLRAVEAFAWIVRARLAGKRVVAVSEADLPSSFEELALPAINALQPQWLWLVERPHPWRRQPWIKGRRLTAGDIVGRMKIESWSPEVTANEMDLSIEAVKEAIEWANVPDNAALIAAEDAEDTLAADSVAPALAEAAAGASVR